MRFRNPADAFLGSLEELVEHGQEVEVRGARTRELLSKKVSFELPLERCITVAHRNNNIFASIAETMWVVAGRDDVAFLTPYLPRAAEFSDDGATWRGAYGPRIRDWRGTDQLAEVVSILKSDPTSRRAVMSVFDPARDFSPSKDIPCTNWLHPIIRDGAVHLEVVMRSNDIVWGFSGINSFEWTVVLEMLAEWLDVEVGSITFFISSMHLYEYHDERARRMLSSPRPVAWPEGSRQFATAFDDLPSTLDRWFEVEAAIRADPSKAEPVETVKDPLFKDFARMIRVFWLHQTGAVDVAQSVSSEIVDAGLRFAAEEFLGRDDADAFWNNYESYNSVARHAELVGTLIELHTGKDSQYGDSWKKRGEFPSIVNNIARKADRLVRWDDTAPPTIDIIDTVADLAVYAAKYSLFLFESNPQNAMTSLGDPDVANLSTGPAGLARLFTVSGRRWLDDPAPADTARVLDDFATIISDFHDGVPVSEPAERLTHALALAESSIVLLRQITRDHRSVFLEWRTQALRLVVPVDQSLSIRT